MNLRNIGINELRDRVAAQLLRTVGTGVYGDQPYVMDLFPDQGSVVYAISGGYFQRGFELAEDLTVTLGAESPASARTEWLPEFQTTFSEEDGVWSGLLFRAGTFAERVVNGQALTINADHIRAIVANFTGFAPLHVDHNEDSVMAEVLKSFGAGVTRLWHNADATELYGEVRRPGWLASAFRDLARKVSVGLSATFDRLNELSLVKTPRITDAALYTAFSASPDFPAFAASHPEAAVTVRAKSTEAPDPHDPMRLTAKALAYFQGNPEAAAAAGYATEQLAAFAASLATPPNPAPAPAPTAPIPPAPVAAVPLTAAPAAAIVAPTPDPDQERRIAELERRFSQQTETETDRADALELYENGLRAGKIVPAERASVMARFDDARTADRTRFSDGSQTPSVDRLKAEIEARAPRFHMGPARIASQDPSLDIPGDTVLSVSPYSAADFAAAGLGKPQVNLS